jgi:hypothetical protein
MYKLKFRWERQSGQNGARITGEREVLYIEIVPSASSINNLDKIKTFQNRLNSTRQTSVISYNNGYALSKTWCL